MPAPIRDLTGQKFGRLTVIELAGQTKWRISQWRCKCDCGGERITTRSSLVQGLTVSCGCYQAERTIEASTKHGLHNHPLYWVWRQIKDRCQNPNNPNYASYGGRGITICDRWAASFPDFLADVGERPQPGLSIDRIENDKGYEPDNIRWATQTEQARNSRQTRWVDWRGWRRRVPDLADEYGIPVKTVRDRLRAGWTIEEVLLAAKEPRP